MIYLPKLQFWVQLSPKFAVFINFRTAEQESTVSTVTESDDDSDEVRLHP